METVDVQKYIMSRFLELLHKETLDTYRVRNNNVFTSIIETRDIIQRCSEMKVKSFDTVKAFVEETIELLEDDKWLQFNSYPRSLLIQELNVFLKNNSKIPLKQSEVDRILFCLNKCLNENKSSYLKGLFVALNNTLTDCVNWEEEEMRTRIKVLDSIIRDFCVQLLYEGYSKQYLFLELKYRSEMSYEVFHQALKDLVKKKKHSFEVIWRLRIKGAEPIDLDTLGFTTRVNEARFGEMEKMKFAKKIAPAPYVYFYQREIRALDRYAAVRQSREELMQRFDSLHLGVYSKELALPDKAIVLEMKDDAWYAHTRVAGFFLDGLFGKDFSLSVQLFSSLNRIYQSKVIDNSVKERIRSSIRHLNYGDLDSEIGQRFINYWIALEYIFASPQASETTYTRLKDNLINVLAVSYILRNMRYLKEGLVSEGIIADDYNLWESADSLDAVANRQDIPLIWRYKLKNMKSRLYAHEDKLKEYYKNHIKNLERHLARIYNLRNLLVHEAAINQDVENLASNLRYYLVFLLDQLIVFFETHASDKGRIYQLGDFFNEYLNYRRYIESNCVLKSFTTIPINKSLW